MIQSSQRRESIKIFKPELAKSLSFIVYYTTTEVASYLGLTYEEFFSLPTTDPDKLKLIFDLGEIVHRLINSDYYKQLAISQDEQMKERAEWRKRVLRKQIV
jgi:hypothetical protein